MWLNSRAKFLPFFLSFLFLFVLSAFHFPGLDWGTPTEAKLQQLVGSKTELAQLIPEMQAARERLFEGYQKGLEGDPKYMNTKWLAKSAERPDYWAEYNRDQSLAAIRSILLGVPSDDQQTISALSRLSIKRRQWDPQNYTYGTFYFAALGATLGASALVGYLPRTLSLSQFLENPDYTARVYWVSRALSVLGTIVAGGLLFLLLWRSMDPGWAGLAALFFWLSPLTVALSHLAKPHTMNVAFLMGALYFCCRRLEDAGEKRMGHLLGAALCLAAATGTAITSLAAFVILPLTEWLRARDKPGSFSWWILIQAVGIGLALAAILNFFALIHPQQAFRVFRYHNFTTGQGTVRASGILFFLRTFFPNAITAPALLLALFGGFLALARRESRGILFFLTGLIYFATNMVLLRHNTTALFLVLLVALLATQWTAFALQHPKRLPLGAVTLLLWVLALGSFWQKDLVLKRRLVRSGTLTEAGAWINANLPKGSRIGLKESINPYFPAFQFLNYRLISVPETLRGWQDQKLPTYFVALEEETSLPPPIPPGYGLVKHFIPYKPGDQNPLFILTNDNSQVFIYELQGNRAS